LITKADSEKPSATSKGKPALAEDLADPYSNKLPPSVWSITGQPETGNNPTAKDSAIKIIRQHPLIIKNVLDEEVVIPWQTKQRYLYSGKGE